MDRIALSYSMTTPDLDLSDEEPTLQHWSVQVLQHDEAHEMDTGQPSEPRSIGTAQATVVSLECPAPIQYLDEIDQDLSNISMFFFDVEGGWLKEEFEDVVEDAGGVVILSRVDLDPSVRGHGLGPVVASEIMLTFRRLGCVAALMEAESSTQEQCDKLCAVWEQAGMRRVSLTKPFLISSLRGKQFDEANERARERCTLIA